MAKILFAPPFWSPVIIRDNNRANQLIRRRGYRNERPGIKAIATPTPEPTKTKEAPTPSGFPINTASFEALVDLDGVGAVTAKKIIDARPYDAPEDLIEVTDRIDWLTMNIDYSE